VTDLEKRQEVERKVVRHLIREMKKAGWIVVLIDDGGECDKDTLNPNETEAMDAVFAVDEARIYFRKNCGSKGKMHWVFIVLGNDGWDAICDHSCGSTHTMDDFEKVMTEQVDPYCAKLEAEA